MFIPPAPAAPLPPVTQEHLEAAGMDPVLAAKLVSAHELLLRLFKRDQLVSVAWSGGKDSTVCLLLAVRAYHDAVTRFGLTLPLICQSSDTGIENPVVHFHWLRMIAYLKAYADRFNLDIRFKVAAPTLISSWVVKIISGCGLPTFTNSKQRKCAIDLKREPANRVLKKMIPEIRADISARLDAAPAEFLRLQQMQDALVAIEPVVIIGTRFGESVERDKRMSARGDAAGLIRRNADGFMTLPLIADFSLEDVWETLALAGQDEGAAVYAFAPDFNAGDGGAHCAVPRLICR